MITHNNVSIIEVGTSHTEIRRFRLPLNDFTQANITGVLKEANRRNQTCNISRYSKISILEL